MSILKPNIYISVSAIILFAAFFVSKTEYAWFLKDLEIYLEFINFGIALCAAFFSFCAYKKYKGGLHSSVSLWLFAASILFFLYELFQLIFHFTSFHIDGFGDLVEFLFAASLLFAITNQQNLIK